MMQIRWSIFRVLFIQTRLNPALCRYQMKRCLHKLNQLDTENNTPITSDIVHHSFRNRISEYLITLIEEEKTETSPHKSSTSPNIEEVLIQSRTANYSDPSRSSDDKVLDYENRSSSNMLKSLIALVKYNRRVTSTRFYKECLDKLTIAAYQQKLTTIQLVLLLYVLSWEKTHAHEVKNFLTLLPDISSLSLMDKSIIAESTFRLSIPLKRRDLDCIEETIERESETLVKMEERILLVMLIKALRLGKASATFVPVRLSAAIVKSRDIFSVCDAMHILVLYSEILFAEPRVVKRLISDVMKTYAVLEQRTWRPMTFWLTKGKYKSKYFSNLLHCSSKLNYKFEKHEVQLIERIVKDCYSFFSRYPALCTNILLSLWTMDQKLCGIAQKFLDEHKYMGLLTDKENWKSRARLDTLLSCIEIEAPYIKVPKISTEIQIEPIPSDSINEICIIVAQLAKQFDLSDIKLHCPVKGIYILGVSFQQPILGRVHIDLLDERLCIKFTKEPIGLMHLKQRLLKKLGYVSIFVHKSRITNSLIGLEVIEDILDELIKI